jgi:hypothetical protein
MDSRDDISAAEDLQLEDAPITPLHRWGWGNEKMLKPRLELELGQQLEKTPGRFDVIDFVGKDVQVELKCRQQFDKQSRVVTSKTHNNWVLPSSKIEAARKSTLKTVFFYYWRGDDSLWRLDYEKVDWSQIEEGIPPWHTAPHFYVPANLWRRVEK